MSLISMCRVKAKIKLRFRRATSSISETWGDSLMAVPWPCEALSGAWVERNRTPPMVMITPRQKLRIAIPFI